MSTASRSEETVREATTWETGIWRSTIPFSKAAGLRMLTSDVDTESVEWGLNLRGCQH